MFVRRADRTADQRQFGFDHQGFVAEFDGPVEMPPQQGLGMLQKLGKGRFRQPGGPVGHPRGGSQDNVIRLFGHHSSRWRLRRLPSKGGSFTFTMKVGTVADQSIMAAAA